MSHDFTQYASFRQSTHVTLFSVEVIFGTACWSYKDESDLIQLRLIASATELIFICWLVVTFSRF